MKRRSAGRCEPCLRDSGYQSTNRSTVLQSEGHCRHLSVSEETIAGFGECRDVGKSGKLTAGVAGTAYQHWIDCVSNETVGACGSSSDTQGHQHLVRWSVPVGTRLRLFERELIHRQCPVLKLIEMWSSSTMSDCGHCQSSVTFPDLLEMVILLGLVGSQERP